MMFSFYQTHLERGVAMTTSAPHLEEDDAPGGQYYRGDGRTVGRWFTFVVVVFGRGEDNGRA